MSRKELELERTDYSSGDSKTMNPKRCQEENNNDIEELSKDLTEMGCIIDAVKRPPNICVENCVHEDSGEEAEANEDGYSDEFEEDDEARDPRLNVTKVDTVNDEISAMSSIKLNQSQSCTSANKPTPTMSVSGRSSYGSLPIPQTRRTNMSFTNDRLREIDRHNHILLNKIISARNNRKSSIPATVEASRRPVPSAAVHRKQAQRKIDHDNMILLKKIQRAKSSSCSIRR